MPNTGNQADIPRFVQSDGQVEAWHVDQLAAAIAGLFGLRVRLIAYNSAANYALEVRNQDTTNTRLMVVYDNAGNAYLDLTKALIKLGVGVTADVRIGETTGNVFIGTIAGNATDVDIGSTASIVTIRGSTVGLAGTVVQANGSPIRTAADDASVLANGTNFGTSLTVDVHFGRTTGNVGIGDVNADATDVFIGGTSSFIGITGSTVQINGGTPWTSSNDGHTTGLDADTLDTYHASDLRSVSNQYTGDGSSGAGGRQITTGFKPTMVILERLSNNNNWITQTQSSAMFLGTGPSIQIQSAVHIHNSDGFVVGDGATSGNVNTETYTYTAIR